MGLGRKRSDMSRVQRKLQARILGGWVSAGPSTRQGISWCPSLPSLSYASLPPVSYASLPPVSYASLPPVRAWEAPLRLPSLPFPPVPVREGTGGKGTGSPGEAWGSLGTLRVAPPASTTSLREGEERGSLGAPPAMGRKGSLPFPYGREGREGSP